MAVLYDVPTRSASGEPDAEGVDEALLRHRLLFVPKPTLASPAFPADVESNPIVALRRFAAEHSERVNGSWTAETSGSSLALLLGDGTKEPAIPAAPARRWYGSFVVDGHDSKQLLRALPTGVVAPLLSPTGWHPTGAVWAFVGRNEPDGLSSPTLCGKPEHVDEMREGVITMHTQLCGQKIWRLRPNPVASWASTSGEDGASSAAGVPRVAGAVPGGRIEVRCVAGDRLLIDTGLWYHETSLPPQTGCSLSIARDFSSIALGAEGAQTALAPQAMSSMQMHVVRTICRTCLTPTLTPVGAPPGTCGCMCCTTKRETRACWQSVRRSASLMHWLLVSQMADMVEVFRQKALATEAKPSMLALPPLIASAPLVPILPTARRRVDFFGNGTMASVSGRPGRHTFKRFAFSSDS